MNTKTIATTLLALASLSTMANATISLWQTQSGLTASNITNSTNGGAGWTFNGTGSGVAYDYGDLDEDNDAASIGAGAAIEYIYNFTDLSSSIALGQFLGWNGELTTLKAEQWPDTGVFGIGIPGQDHNFNSASSVFGVETHVLFNFRTDGEVEIFINGASQGIASRGSWIVNGGVGVLGANHTGVDIPTGDILGVATYDNQLTSQEITDLYNAYAVVPEPSSAVLLGLGGISLLLRRRK